MEAVAPVPFYFPLSDALLCVSCDAIYRIPDRVCPRCGSAVFLSLSKVLNREPDDGR